MSKDIDGLIWIHYKERRMRLVWGDLSRVVCYNSDMDSKQQKQWRWWVLQKLMAIVSCYIVLPYMECLEGAWEHCVFSLATLPVFSVQWRSWSCFDGRQLGHVHSDWLPY
jgi:hypothetical protein